MFPITMPLGKRCKVAYGPETQHSGSYVTWPCLFCSRQLNSLRGKTPGQKLSTSLRQFLHLAYLTKFHSGCKDEIILAPGLPLPKKNRRRKTKCAESSETRFHQVSRLYDLISGGGKHPFKVLHFWKIRNFERPFTPRGWLHSVSDDPRHLIFRCRNLVLTNVLVGKIRS